jgi:hypothetical protein
MLACFFTRRSIRGSLCTITPATELSTCAKELENINKEKNTRRSFI